MNGSELWGSIATTAEGLLSSIGVVVVLIFLFLMAEIVYLLLKKHDE